jgi:hypothetical protein
MADSPSLSLWRQLISKRRRSPLKYHFIHIPKNGGQSTRAALARRGDVSLTEPLHSRYRDVVGTVGSDLRYFCIVRNPWSRTASRYLFARQNSVNWPASDPRRIYIEKATFAQFVEEQRIFDIPEHPGRPWMGPMNSWFDQLEWVVDESGVVQVQCLRLEHLDADIAAFFGEPVSVPRKNTTRSAKDYRTLYDDRLVEIVARTFARDIEHFGFSFDSPATRNCLVLSNAGRTSQAST